MSPNGNLIYQSDEVTIETKNQNCDFSDAYDQEFIFLRLPILLTLA